MNPQFQPPQTFAPNRASPALAQQGNFQNISLGPAKPLHDVPVANGPHQPQNNIPNSFPVPSGPPSMSQYGPPAGPPSAVRAPPMIRGFPGIPANQLPPQSSAVGTGMPSVGKSQPPPSTTGGSAGKMNPNVQGFPSGVQQPNQVLTNLGPPQAQSPPQGPPPSQQPPQGPISNSNPSFSPLRNQPSPKPLENPLNGPNTPFPPPSQGGSFLPPAPSQGGAFPPPASSQGGSFLPPPQRSSAPFNTSGPPQSNTLGDDLKQDQSPGSFVNKSQPPTQLPPGPYSTNGLSSARLPETQPQFPASNPGSFPPMGSIPPGRPNFGQIPSQPQSNQFNAPPTQNQQPPLNQPPQNQFAHPPQNQFGQSPQNQFNQPPQNQFNQPPTLNKNQYGQPLPGGQNQFGPPPSQFGQPPNQFGQPPLPGPPQMNPNQLANQMQGMNIGGPRQYPGAPLKTGLDNGPHMPPPLAQQQQQQQQQQQNLVNGQQLRSPQQPGYPPVPGQGGYPQSGYQQAQQRRLDPDQMPSPIQVMQDDQQTRSGVFVTNQKGLVPPLVTTKFVVQDQGNASPRYVRSTMYNVPISQDLMKQTAVPFGLVISPMAKTLEGEYPPPVVNFGELGPVRCIRCKAYMCPYMQFIDSGRRFQCLFCKAATEVPAEYFQHLDHTGQRMDRFERPELVLGTYEFTATSDYCRNNTLPKPPAIIFVIDVSYNNIKSGLINLLCSQMKDIIKNLPTDQGQEKSNMRIGFITYNSSVHFYNIKGNLAAPQMLVVGDVQDMFMPLLDGFLCTPDESETVIDALMQQIPAMFADTRETETVLLPAVLAGLEALKASECVGKLLVFHSSLPIAEAPGKLRMRDDRKLLGTEKEKTVLTPQTQAYNQLGQDCVQFGCSVDLFIFNNSYIDIATISQVSRLTGGEVYKYTYFQADTDGERLVKDVVRNISRPIAFDAVMRVRTSTGVRATDFYGHCYMSNTTDIELASIDCDKALAVEIKHDDKLSEDEGVYIQIALLYTSCSGQRRLRILNLSLKTCSQMADLYRSCELDTLINFFSKQAVYRLLEHNPKAIKDGIINRAAQILANYRKNCASPSSAGQLILPECMKLLPLYVNCLLKSDALSGGSDMTIDDRAFVMQAVMTMDVPSSLVYFYPRLIPLHDINPDEEPLELPFPIRCSIEKMIDQGVYILENGIHMFIWIGLSASPEFIQQVFGVPSAVQVNIEMVRFPVLDNPLNEAVRSVVEQIRSQHHRCMRLTFIRPREKLEPVFKHFLVEDRGVDGSSSYVDFLCHMHKEIRNLLS